MRTALITAPSLIVLLAIATPSAASPLLLNGSFETGPAMNGPLCPIAPTDCQDVTVVAGSNAITDWTVFGTSVDYLGPPWDVSDGIHGIDLDGTDAISSGVSQTFSTIPGYRYFVSFDLSGNPGGSNVIKQMNVSVDGFSNDYFFDTSGQGVDALTWQTIMFSFMASGSSATLAFTSLTPYASSYGALIDNVHVTAPEPPMLLLFVIALATLMIRAAWQWGSDE